MGRSQESFNKKNVTARKEKNRKEKEKKRLARKESVKKGSLEEMIAYTDAYGRITDVPPDPGNKEEIKAEDIILEVPKRTIKEEDLIRKGVVNFFNNDKGYGFIKDLETKQNLFVHVSNIKEEIREGNVVTFEVGAGQKGPAAMNVALYQEPAQE